MKVFVDDVRQAPPGWVWVQTYEEAMTKIATCHIEILSLDHDLGDVGSLTGYDLAKEFVEGYQEGLWEWPDIIFIHTQNVVGGQNMMQLLEHYAPAGKFVIRMLP